MFSILVKCMLIVFMLAGIVGIICGANEIRRTMGFVSASTGSAKATFVGYHREISRSTSIRPYSPANPKMISSTESYAVATYPEFAYRTEHGSEQLVRESKVHVFAIYRPGEEVDILLSDPGYPRIASFYSLYFRDMVIFGLGAFALALALIFWNFALPLFQKPYPVEVYSNSATPNSDSSQTQDTALISESPEEMFNGIFKEAWNFQVGPIKMKHILIGFLALFIFVIIMSFLFGSNRT